MSKEVTPEEFKESYSQLAGLFDMCMGVMNEYGDEIASVSQGFHFTLVGGMPVSITLTLGDAEEGEEGDE